MEEFNPTFVATPANPPVVRSVIRSPDVLSVGLSKVRGLSDLSNLSPSQAFDPTLGVDDAEDIVSSNVTVLGTGEGE